MQHRTEKSGITVRTTRYLCDEDGIIDVSEADAAILQQIPGWSVVRDPVLAPVKKELEVPEELPIDDTIQSADMTRAQLAELCEKRGIAVPKYTTKTQLLELLK